MPNNPPLIINNWQRGIGSSQHTGLGLIRNCDIDEFPGAITANKKVSSRFHPSYSQVFTAEPSTDICTAPATVPSTGVAVTLTTTGTLPAGLSTGTTYFVKKVSSTTFKLATTIANAESENPADQIDITDAGSGTHTITTIQPGTIKHFAEDTRGSGTAFCIDSNGRVWYLESTFRLLNGNTLTNASGNGLAILRTSNGNATYLFAFRNNSIDVVDVFGVTDRENPSWTNGWKTMNTAVGESNSHQAIRSQDDIIYFCDDRYVGSIKENSGSVFDPATPATYTYNNQALDLPVDEIAEWLEELDVELLVAGLNTNKIYPWDRISDSFRLTLNVPEKGIYRLKNLGGIVYIAAGQTGKLYITQGTYVKDFVQLPYSVINNGGELISNIVTWGGVGEKDGSLLIGLSQQTTGNSGVYRIWPDGRFVIDAIPSTGSKNATAISSGDFYLLGYNGGADGHDGDRRSNYECVVQSELFRVGTKTKPAGYSELEIQLAKSVIEGKIRVRYRTDTDSSFGAIPGGEVEVTNLASNTSFKFQKIGLRNLENIQIQVEFQDDVELMEIRLIP